MRKLIIMAGITLMVMTSEARYRFEVFPLLQEKQLTQSSINGMTIYLTGHEILSSLAKEAGLLDAEEHLLSIRIANIDFDAESASYNMAYELLNNNGTIVSSSNRRLERGSDGWLYLVGGK